MGIKGFHPSHKRRLEPRSFAWYGFSLMNHVYHTDNDVYLEIFSSKRPFWNATKSIFFVSFLVLNSLQYFASISNREFAHQCPWQSLYFLSYSSSYVKNVYNLYNIILFLILCMNSRQLYKTTNEKYLLDLQRLSDPQFIFLDFCAIFMIQLEVS